MRQWAELRWAVGRDWSTLRPMGEELALFGEPGQNYDSDVGHASSGGFK